MNTIYHIQRMKKPYNSNGEGLDKYFRMDYMGSAEFEFGALPASLKRVRKHLNEYAVYDLPDIDKRLRVFCKSEDLPMIEEFVKINATNNYEPRLKELTCLTHVLEGEGYNKDTTGWWDIDNDWFMTIGQEDITKVINGVVQK